MFNYKQLHYDTEVQKNASWQARSVAIAYIATQYTTNPYIIS